MAFSVETMFYCCHVNIRHWDRMTKLKARLTKPGTGRPVFVSKNETVRLCYIIADPLNSTVLSKLYNKPDCRTDIDRGRHGPWSNEFGEQFNDEDLLFNIPDAIDGYR